MRKGHAALPRALFAFHELVRLGALWLARGFCGFEWGLFVFVLGFLWVLVRLFVFCEACSPLPMGGGPGVRSGFE